MAVVADADGDAADAHGDGVLVLLRLSDAHRLTQRPDVVVREPQRLYLRQLRVLRECGQDAAQFVQRLVQHVHAVPLPVVRLLAPVLLQTDHLCSTERSL